MAHTEKGNYEKIYQKLVEQKDKILEKNDEVLIATKSGTDVKGDEYDFAQYEMLEDIDAKLNNRNILLLNKINKALDRFMEDDYGICHDCGDVIPFKRLVIEPTTEYCVDCQSNDEKSDEYYEKVVNIKVKRASSY